MTKSIENIENIGSIIDNWKQSSDLNFITMQNLIKSKDYSWALFMGHLVIEKLIKANYVKRHKAHSIFSHDLLRLTRKVGLEIPNNYDEWLDEITTFNINARYDNYKQEFYKLCTKEFTELWIKRIEGIREWLIQQL